MKYSILLAGLLAAWGGYAHAESTAPSEIVTARREFLIPFRYDRRELNRLGARAVVLSVSRDAGASWQQIRSVAISENQFRFRAAEDGSYWFSVAVQGADNQLHPRPDAGNAGLKVLVDHVQPAIDLALTRPNDEQVQLNWSLTDKTLDLTTLQMEYRYGANDAWKKVYISALEQGRTTWKVPTGAEPQVRCRVADQAGNQAERIVSVMPKHQTAAISQPVHGPARDNSMKTAGPALTAGRPAASVADAELPQISPTSSGQVRANRPNSLPEIVSTPPAKPQTRTESQTRTEPQSPVASQNSSQAGMPSLPLLALPSETESNSGAVTQTVAAEANVKSSAESPLQNLVGTVTAKDSNRQPAKAMRNFVPSRGFQIDYEVTGVGPSGVGVVEVYITQDNGDQWWRYGVDADRQSPVEIQVPADGQYGFCFRIHSGVGNAEPPPQPGEEPQVQLQVDSAAPHLKLLQTRQGRGSQLREVTVDWDLVDDNPGEAPLSVFIAGSPEGPWRLIENQIVDRGSYTFQLPQDPPFELFVKLQAVDLAGNRSEAISTEPILLDLARPTARVLTVDPIR